MKLWPVFVVGATFPVSVAIAYFARKFWLGFIVPPAALAIWLFGAAFDAAGWKIDQIGLPLAFLTVPLVLLGLPSIFLSGLGATIGWHLSNVFGTKKTRVDESQNRQPEEH